MTKRGKAGQDVKELRLRRERNKWGRTGQGRMGRGKAGLRRNEER